MFLSFSVSCFSCPSLVLFNMCQGKWTDSIYFGSPTRAPFQGASAGLSVSKAPQKDNPPSEAAKYISNDVRSIPPSTL